MIWETIEDELKGEFARGYALAQHMGIHDIRRNCKVGGELLDYEWGDFSDYVTLLLKNGEMKQATSYALMKKQTS